MRTAPPCHRQQVRPAQEKFPLTPRARAAASACEMEATSSAPSLPQHPPPLRLAVRRQRDQRHDDRHHAHGGEVHRAPPVTKTESTQRPSQRRTQSRTRPTQQHCVATHGTYTGMQRKA
eukprot:scaffold2213_cov444-Prasinococcus_capsulatus_cf.AAC.17